MTGIQEDPGKSKDDCRDDRLALLTMTVSKKSNHSVAEENGEASLRGNYEALLSAVLTRLTLTLGMEPVRLVQSHAKLTAGRPLHAPLPSGSDS